MRHLIRLCFLHNICYQLGGDVNINRWGRERGDGRYKYSTFYKIFKTAYDVNIL